MQQHVPRFRRGDRAALIALLVLAGILTTFASPAFDKAAPWPPQLRSPLMAQPQPDCEIGLSIDTPADAGTVRGVVEVTGWAADPAATEGTGVDGVQLWLGGPPGEGTLLGDAQLGVNRPDLEASMGANYAGAGWRYTWDTKGNAGPVALYAAAHGACGWSWTSRAITVAPATPGGAAASAPTPARPAGSASGTPGACPARIVTDAPGLAIGSTGVYTVTGWAADPSAGSGTGVTAVGIWPSADTSGPALATGVYGLTRPDASTALGNPRFGRSGFAIPIDASAIPSDTAALTLAATGACGSVTATLPITRDAGAAAAPTPSATAPVTASARITATATVTRTTGGVSGLTPISGTRPLSGTPGIQYTPPPTIEKVEQQGTSGFVADTRSVVVKFAPTPNATGYILYRGNQPNGSFSEVATAAGNADSVIDTQLLSPGTYYYYLVATYPGGARSQGSNVVSVQVR